MSKLKRKKKQALTAYTVQFPVVGFVTLSPSRESYRPFCAYYGPKGETCSTTAMVETVAMLPCRPPVVYMACPVHYDEVKKSVERFLASLQDLSKHLL